MDNWFSARKAVSVFLALVIVISTFFVMPITSSAYSNKYKVTANGNLNMRKTASSKGEVVEHIKKGQALYIQKNSSGNWVYCKNSSGKAGYVPVKHINKTKDSSVYMTCKTTDAVNLRKGAGTSYAVITVVPNGTTMNISVILLGQKLSTMATQVTYQRHMLMFISKLQSQLIQLLLQVVQLKVLLH